MAKIKLSKKDKIDSDEFSSKYAKERISIWIDEDVLDEFRKTAAAKNGKYQTLINEVLRAYAFSPKNKKLDKVLSKMEIAMKELKSLQSLE